MPGSKTQSAEKQVEHQMPTAPIADEMIGCTVQAGKQQGEEKSWQGHKGNRLCRHKSRRACSKLRFQVLCEEISDGVVAGDPVLIFEHIMAFIFEDQQVDILALGL